MPIKTQIKTINTADGKTLSKVDEEFIPGVYENSWSLAGSCIVRTIEVTDTETKTQSILIPFRVIEKFAESTTMVRGRIMAYKLRKDPDPNEVFEEIVAFNSYMEKRNAEEGEKRLKQRNIYLETRRSIKEPVINQRHEVKTKSNNGWKR